MIIVLVHGGLALKSIPDLKCDFAKVVTKDFEIPILKNAQNYLDKARKHLADKDYKACAVYVRSEFELSLKKLADKKNLAVKYAKSPERISSEDFWKAIKKATRRDPSTGQQIPMLTSNIITAIETFRKFVLNPLNHSQLINIYERELEDAINAVDNLTTEIQNIR